MCAAWFVSMCLQVVAHTYSMCVTFYTNSSKQYIIEKTNATVSPLPV